MLDYVGSIMDGRPVMWCCLSCGMPFTYPEEAYDVDNARVQALITVSRGMRLALADPALPCTQWNATRTPVLSPDLLVNVLRSVVGDGAEGPAPQAVDAGDPKTSAWQRLTRYFRDFLARPNANDDERQASTQMTTRIADVMDTMRAVEPGGVARWSCDPATEAKRTVVMCQGCAAVAGRLASDGSASLAPLISEVRGVVAGTDGFPAVCILAAAHVSHFATMRHRKAGRAGGQMSEQEAWRLECITRLHLGNLIYMCSRYLAPVDVPFETWYTCIFHPLIEYEQWVTHGDSLARADFSDPEPPAPGGPAELYSHRDGDVSTSFSSAAIMEVLARVNILCRSCPFAWVHDVHSVPGGAADGPRFADYYKFSGTLDLMRIASDPSIPWAPVCVIYGLPGDLLLRRLRGSMKKWFQSKGSITRVLRVYMDEESEFARVGASA